MPAKKKPAKKAATKKVVAKKAAPTKKAVVSAKKVAAPKAAPKKVKKAASNESSVRMDINDRFRRWKDKSGISGSEIARGSGQTPAYISKVYSGNANLGLGLLVYLANDHNVSISWLLTGKGAAPEAPAAKKAGKKK